MHRSRPLIALFAWVATAAGCNGPLPFMSGGRLAGTEVPAPAEWSFDEDFGVIQLETRPPEPYSVNIAYTLIDTRLYIYAGDTKTEWVQHMEADSRVRFRIGAVIHPLDATRVTDANETRAFAEVWVDQSIFHRDPMDLEQTWLYRLEPR